MMNIVRQFFRVVTLVVLPLVIESPCAASEVNTLLVTGSFNELKDERWKDERIGFGVRSLINQAFFETGQFTIVEENAEIRDRLRAISQGMWGSTEKKYDLKKDTEESKLMGAKFLAYGKVYYFGRPQTKVSVGVLQSRIVETIIRIEISLQNTETGKTIKKNGTGKAETTANTILFEVRDNGVMFDETTVGVATKKAIGEAVAEIMKDFKKLQ